jgi:wyosine [tRNA(Phe)-imidazoG37] synthetase (radical SAM superfamily)
MPTFLFDNIIFGPVSSRRLGVSLGINLLPVEKKFCNFNCVYCECGLTYDAVGGKNLLPSREIIAERLRDVLIKCNSEGKKIDTITFAGNGEPTLHPEFCEVVDDTVLIRNELMPAAQISVLTNATLLDDERIVRALKKVDRPMLKLDAGTEATYRALNQPITLKTLKEIVSELSAFGGKCVIQTLFTRFTRDGMIIDNTVETEVVAWLSLIAAIRPEKVIIYSTSRDTALAGVEQILSGTLQSIAERVRALGIAADVY